MSALSGGSGRASLAVSLQLSHGAHGASARLEWHEREGRRIGLLQLGGWIDRPALLRLEQKGWIASEWGTSPEGKRAKFYTLTREGKKQFAAERSQWRLFSSAVEQVLSAT